MRRQRQGLTLTGKIFALVMVSLACLALYLIYQQHKDIFEFKSVVAPIPKLPDLTASEQKTLEYINNRPLPSMDSNYLLIFQSPQPAAEPPELDYLTTEPKQTVIDTVEGICRQYSFKVKRPIQSFDLVNQVKSYAIDTVDCYDAHNSWSFSIELATALTYSEYSGPGSMQADNIINGHVPSGIASSLTATDMWVNVRSLGAPQRECEISSVCY